MAITRQIIIGLSPGVKQIYGQVDQHYGETMSWPYVVDGNSSQQSFTCAYVPSAKTADATPFQEALWLGTRGASTTIRTLVSGLTFDDATLIAGEGITNRLDPTILTDKVGASKRFDKVEFPGTNPLSSKNNLTIETAFNIGDPITDPVLWTSVVSSGNTDKATIKNGLGSWMHLRFSDTHAPVDKILLDVFKLYYYELAEEENEVEG